MRRTHRLRGSPRREPATLPPDVAAAFAAFPDAVRRQLLQVRALIFGTAAELDGVGPLAETSKWGGPAT